MKSDLKINFSVIQEIAESINTYRKALETMQEALNSINGRLESENSGQAVTALIERHEELQNDINTCKEELESLHRLFDGFYQDMTGIIHPVNYGAEVRVDRLDIYLNMQTIFRSIDVVKTLWTHSQYTPVYNTSSSYTYGGGSSPTDEEQKNKEENNHRKMEEIWDIIKSYGNRFEDDKEEMEFLFNRYIVPYEEMDNQYGDSANKLYAQKATAWDRVKDFGEGVYNLGAGVVDLGIDLLKFPFVLGGGILQYGMGGTGYLISKVTGDTPGFFDYTEDKFHETNKKVKSVFNNPWEGVEDLAQQTSDDYEEKGLMHTIGYYGMGYLTTRVRFKSVTVSAAEGPTIRNKVLNNIAESRMAREASDYKKFAEFEKSFKNVLEVDTSIISDEMRNKILDGHRKNPKKNELIGGHSPKITNENPNYAIEEISINEDLTRKVRFTTQFSDGKLAKIKTSTLFPESWSEDKIIEGIKTIGNTTKIGVRSRDGATLHRGIIDGVQIEVIKLRNDVTSGYPTGGGVLGLLTGFQ